MGNVEISRKRARISSIDQYDGYEFEWPDDRAFQNELNHIMTAVETPRKEAQTDGSTTPSAKRTLPWNKIRQMQTDASPSGLQTPQTTRTVQENPFSSKLSKSLLTPSISIDADHQIATPSSSPYETPTPNRFKDVGTDDLTLEVFALLQDDKATLGAATERNLRALLYKHTKAAEGLRRGRDVTRSTIKARDAKITELSYRISTLEAELEAEKAVVRHLQWEIGTEDHGSL